MHETNGKCIQNEVGKAEGKRPKDPAVNRIIPEYYLLGYNAVSVCHLVSCSDSSTLNMEAMFLRNNG
jgi:hypothetical protein